MGEYVFRSVRLWRPCEGYWMALDDFKTESRSFVRFWGVRGSVPTPGPSTVGFGGNTSCVEVRIGDEIVVFDAGTGIRLLGDYLEREFPGRDLELTIFLSHTHWDHIQGIPFFRPAYRLGNSVRILGRKAVSGELSKILADQMDSPHFPVPMENMVGSVVVEDIDEARVDLPGGCVKTVQLQHPGGATGYRIDSQGSSVAYLTDHEPATYESGDRPEAAALNAELIEFIRGVDVLIMDAQYSQEEYLKHVGWGHGSVDDVVRIGAAGQVGRLFLFHHDPYHDDEKLRIFGDYAANLARELGSGLSVVPAREGDVVWLGEQKAPQAVGRGLTRVETKSA